MNPDKLHQILIETFGEEYETRNMQFRMNCTSSDCRDKSGNLEINLDKGIFHCWICGYSGTVRTLFQDSMGRVPDMDEYVSADSLKKFEASKVFDENLFGGLRSFEGLPKEFRPLWKKDEKLSVIGEKALQYALSRMSWEDIIVHNIGYCGLGKYQWRLIVPCFDEEENIVYFIGRSIYKSTFPYMNSDSPKRDVIFNYNRALKVGRAVIVEGVFDAIRVGNEGTVGIALLGTAVTEEQAYKLNKINDLTMILDNDAYKKSVDISRQFYKKFKKHIKVYGLPDKRDPDQYPRDELQEMVRRAKLVSVDEGLFDSYIN